MSSWDDVTTEREKPETTKRPREAKEGKESTPSSSKKVRSGSSIQSEDSHLPEQEDSTNLFIQNQSSSSSSSSFLSSQPNNPLNAIEQDIREIQTSIKNTESSIYETALEINTITLKIEQLEEEIKATTDPDEKNKLLDEKNRLLDEKKQLRNKENLLLGKENLLLGKEEQLRKEKNKQLARLAENEKKLAAQPPLYDLSTPESIIESMKRVSERIPGLQFSTPEEMLKPNKLIPPHFQNFIDRDDALKNAISLLSKDIAHDQQRFKYPIVATAAGSGTGKTRFCDELVVALILRQQGNCIFER